jgi:prevent-host-death family protein
MLSISVHEAQTRLAELIQRLAPGDEIVITENDQPVARLIAAAPQVREPRKLGTLKGTVLYMAPDFDAPLDT